MKNFLKNPVNSRMDWKFFGLGIGFITYALVVLSGLSYCAIYPPLC